MDRRPPSVLLIAAHDTTSVCSCHFYLNAKERLHSFLEDLRNEAQNQARSEIHKAQELILDAESYGLSILGEFAFNEFAVMSEAKEFLLDFGQFVDCDLYLE
jgi:hypothetical protein